MLLTLAPSGSAKRCGLIADRGSTNEIKYNASQ